MKRNRKLLLAGISIVLGLMLMRVAWIVVDQQRATVIIVTGSILFLGGVVVFALTFFNRKNRY